VVIWVELSFVCVEVAPEFFAEAVSDCVSRFVLRSANIFWEAEAL
jgi:hypothetical protein